jgi:hypothetical protein
MMSIDTVIESKPATSNDSWARFEEALRELAERYKNADDEERDSLILYDEDAARLFHPGRPDFERGHPATTVIDFGQTPVLPPSVLKKVYTLYSEYIPTEYTGDRHEFPEEMPVDPFFTLCGIMDSTMYALDHLKVMHEVKPSILTQFHYEEMDGIDHGRTGLHHLFCRERTLSKQVLPKVLECIEWVISKAPTLLIFQFDEVLEFINRCQEEQGETELDLLPFLLKMNLAACAEKCIQGNVNVLLHLIFAVAPPPPHAFLHYLAEEKDLKALRKLIKVGMVDEARSITHSLVDVILHSSKAGDDLIVLDLVMVLQPDVTAAPSGLPLFAVAAATDRNLDVIFTLLSCHPEACDMRSPEDGKDQ